MRIQEQDKMHGAALVQIAEARQFTGLNKPEGAPYGVYTLNHDTALMIKYANRSQQKWSFTFFPEHVRTAGRLAATFRDRTFVVLVCDPEAVCMVPWSELAPLLNAGTRTPQAVRCEIPAGKSIRLYGPGNKKLDHTVPRRDVPRRLFETDS